MTESGLTDGEPLRKQTREKDIDPVRVDRVSRWIIIGRNKDSPTGCAGRDIGAHCASGYALRSVCPYVSALNRTF